MMKYLNFNVTVSAKEGQSTDAFNSLVFHTDSAVNFGCTGISDAVSDVSMTMSVIVWDGMMGRC